MEDYLAVVASVGCVIGMVTVVRVDTTTRNRIIHTLTRLLSGLTVR